MNYLQGIGSAVLKAEAGEKIMSDWNQFTFKRRKAIYDRHYRLMVGMMDKYGFSTCETCHKINNSDEYRCPICGGIN